jgi:hypothetical protein
MRLALAESSTKVLGLESTLEQARQASDAERDVLLQQLAESKTIAQKLSNDLSQKQHVFEEELGRARLALAESSVYALSLESALEQTKQDSVTELEALRKILNKKIVDYSILRSDNDKLSEYIRKLQLRFKWFRFLLNID